MKQNLLLILIALILLMPASAYASNLTDDKYFFKVGKEEKLIYQAVEITDYNVLFHRAKQHILECPNTPKVRVRITKDGQEVPVQDIKTYVTVQKLKSKFNFKDGTTTTLYRQDAFVPLGFLFPDTKSRQDDSYSVIATNTVYYELITVPYGQQSREAYNIAYVTGKWDIKSNQVQLSQSRLGYDWYGTAYNGAGEEIGPTIYENFPQTPSNGYPMSGETYYVYDNHEDFYVMPFPDDLGVCRGKQYTKITRGGYSWDFTLLNEID